MNLETQRHKLAEWLQAFHLDQALAADDGEDTAGSSPFSGTAPAQPAGPPPAAGQIRLWPARELADPPFYGLVLPGSYGVWQVVPFSTLPLPATPGEYLLRDTGPARVLQGWNLRTLHAAGAAAAWHTDDLPAAELFPVQDWLTWLQSAAPPQPEPPARFAAACGPPLRHPEDPRHTFLESEWARAGRTLGEWLTGAGQAEFDLAAEPPPQWPTDPDAPRE